MSYGTLFKKTFFSKTFYIGEFITTNLDIFFQAIISIFVGIYFNNINTIFQGNEIFIYYLFGTGIINAFQRRNPVTLIQQEISMGNISVHLAKPYNFIRYIFTKDIALKTFNSIFNFIIMYLIIGITFGFFIIPINNVIRAIIILPLTITYIYLNVAIFAYLTFHFEQIDYASSIYGMISYFIGGGLLATTYFPNFVEYIPQYFYFSGPLFFIIHGTTTHWFLYIIYWILLILLVQYLHKKTIQKLEINGG